MMSDFKIVLSDLLKARFPYIYIPTWEEERSLSTISDIGTDESLIKTTRKVFTWRSTIGISEDGFSGKQETKAPLKALEFVGKFEEPAVFVFLDFHVYLGYKNHPPDHQVVRKLRDLLIVLKQSPNPKNVIFISPSLVLPDELQKDVTIVDFELPTFEDIKKVLDDMIEANKHGGRIVIDLTPEHEERLAKAAVGLTLQEAENAFARAMVDDGRLDINDVKVILEEKSQIIKKIGILEFIDSEINIEDIGGLENLKRWLIKRDKSWLDSAKRYCIPSPKGVLITGVPGCGKSLVAKAISSMWQLPLLRLDVSRIFSGLIGSSEENMRRAIRVAEAISPCILWIDEIEKGFSGMGSSGDSGTSSRVFGTFLTWMQEKTKPVFVVATSNNINNLPSELLRKGRFDEIFFVDLPTHRERMEIFKVHADRRLRNPEVKGDFETSNENLSKLADITEGFGGSEIEQIIISGLFDAFSEDRNIKLSDFENAIQYTVPLSVTQAEQIVALRNWANVRAVAATSQEYRVEYEEKEEEKTEDILKSRGGRTIDF